VVDDVGGSKVAGKCGTSKGVVCAGGQVFGGACYR